MKRDEWYFFAILIFFVGVLAIDSVLDLGIVDKFNAPIGVDAGRAK